MYRFVTKKILFKLVGKPAAWFDRNVVDGMINLTGNATERISEGIKKVQSGKVQSYAMYFLQELSDWRYYSFMHESKTGTDELTSYS